MIFSTVGSLNVEMSDVKFLEAGIHENAAPAGARFDKSPNGNNFIEFKFSKDGSILTHTEYEPTKFGDESDESLQNKIDNQIKRIMQILKVFYTSDKLAYSATSFESFAQWVVALFSSVEKTKLVRLKVVYNNSGYTELPRYWKYTFIESMEVNKESSKIAKLNTKIDRFTRPEQGDKEEQTKTAVETFSAASTGSIAPGSSDSPF